MPLDSDGIRRLVETIDETPETVIPIHLLTQGTCKAYAVGDPASSDAVIVQSDSLREEPFGLGSDATTRRRGRLKSLATLIYLPQATTRE